MPCASRSEPNTPRVATTGASPVRKTVHHRIGLVKGLLGRGVLRKRWDGESGVSHASREVTVTRIGIGLLVACVLSGPAAYAHHSFSVDYFEDRSISLEGSVEEFLYRNPHAILKVRVVDAEGTPVSYAAEWAGAGRLGGLGITAETLQPGDVVQIVGAPGRIEAAHRVHLKRIVRPSDGWSWGNNRGGGRRR